MSLRGDTVRIKEPAIGIGRLSLHRLQTKRGCALRAVGIGAAQGCDCDQG